MSKINGDKKRDHLRARKQTKMREKMRELRATLNAAPATKVAAPKVAEPKVATKAPKAAAESKQPA